MRNIGVGFDNHLEATMKKKENDPIRVEEKAAIGPAILYEMANIRDIAMIVVNARKTAGYTGSPPPSK